MNIHKLFFLVFSKILRSRNIIVEVAKTNKLRFLFDNDKL